MKKFISWLVAALVGLLLIFLVNISSLSYRIPGIRLTFGWEGPYLWVLESNNYKDKGTPVNFYKADKNYDSYWNNLALGINALVGVGLGIGAAYIIQKPKH